MIYDPVSGKPSITLSFAISSFFLAIASMVGLHLGHWGVWPTVITASFWALATILYIIRKITSVKFDLDDKSISLENDDESKTST